MVAAKGAPNDAAPHLYWLIRTRIEVEVGGKRALVARIEDNEADVGEGRTW